MHCLAYIYFVLKDVFSHRFKTSEKPPSTAKMENVLRIKCTKNDTPIDLQLIHNYTWCTGLYVLPYFYIKKMQKG